MASCDVARASLFICKQNKRSPRPTQGVHLWLSQHLCRIIRSLARWNHFDPSGSVVSPSIFTHTGISLADKIGIKLCKADDKIRLRVENG